MMQEITIGRKQDNDVVLNDPMVGRCVAKVIRHDDGHYSIVDLMSTNGVYVNGKRIPTGGEIIINNNDVILIGKTALNLEGIILRARLGGLSINDPTFPPTNNAMCYCPAPPDESTDDTSNDGSGNSIPIWKIILLIEGAILLGILLYFYLVK